MGNDLKKIGNQTIKLNSKPKIISTYSIVGPKEGQGPLGQYFHEVISDDTLGKDSFEKAESEMMYTAIKGAINSANLKEEDICNDLSNFINLYILGIYICLNWMLSQCIYYCFGSWRKR